MNIISVPITSMGLTGSALAASGALLAEPPYGLGLPIKPMALSDVTGCMNSVRHLRYRPWLCRLCHARIQCSADAFLEVRVCKGAALPQGGMLPGAGLRLLTQIQAGMYGILDMSILRR